MAKYQILALTNAVQGKEDEFKKWYTGTHIPDVKRFPGVVTGSLHTLVNNLGKDCKYKYLAVYNVETDLTPEEFSSALLARAGTDQMYMSPAFDFEDFQMLTFAPVT